MAVLCVFKWTILLNFCFHFIETIHGQDPLEYRQRYSRGTSHQLVKHRLKAWVKSYDPIGKTVTLKWKPPAEVNKLDRTRIRILDENNTRVWNVRLTQLATESIVYGLKFDRKYRARIRTTTKFGHTYNSKRIWIQINECTACHREYGKCSDRINCVCVEGWEGKFCHQCRRKPGCIHGTCKSPGECVCHPGWAGDLCSLATEDVIPPIITDIHKPIPPRWGAWYHVNITWEDTMVDTSDLTYVIYANKTIHGGIGGGGVTTYNTTGVNSLQIKLWLNTMYDIRMRTVRGDNYSISSRPVTFSTYYSDGIHLWPQNIILIWTEARTVKMIWDPPHNYVYGVLGYSVTHRQKCRPRGYEKEVIIGNQTSYTFDNLRPFCRYKFEIASINAYGQSMGFDFIHCTLPESLKAPKDLSVKSWTSDQLYLEWVDRRLKGPECGFKKTFTVLMNGTTVVRVTNNESTSLNLEPNRNYTFQVRKDLSIIYGYSASPYYGQVLGTVSSPYSEVLTVITDGVNRDLTFQDAVNSLEHSATDAP